MYDEVASDNSEYPDFNLDAAKLPEIKDWETGKEYTIVLKVKQLTKNETAKGVYGSKGSASAGFKIISAKVGNEKKPSDMTFSEQKDYLADQKRKYY